jgi:hypothetical protein
MNELPTTDERVVVNTSDFPSVRITGEVFEAGPDGWCKHCGWAEFAHVIGATTGRLYCPADKDTKV